jgi:hypothetical protein
MTFRSDIQCEPRQLVYDFEERVGTLKLAPGHCTDMSGCIKLFKAIDPDVLSICTTSDNRKDTVYARDAAGEWRAFNA